jgi:membrane complex biogenesis BtpA family protein
MEGASMSKEWVKILFRTEKPVIAMAHLPALPGTPLYDQIGGIEKLVDAIAKDVECLLESGVDAIMFCNEDDRPYVFKAEIEQIAAMTHVITKCAPHTIPFGVDFLWDPMAAIAIAHATGASFVREVLTGVYESDMGLWMPNAGEAMRLRSRIGADNIRVFYNVVPEFATSIGQRTVEQRAKSVITSCLAEGILVSGPMAGAEPELSHFYAIKEAIGDAPVFINTGATADNIATYFEVADGVIVGSSLKVDGITWNPVDSARALAFMEQALQARGQLTEDVV